MVVKRGEFHSRSLWQKLVGPASRTPMIIQVYEMNQRTDIALD